MLPQSETQECGFVRDINQFNNINYSARTNFTDNDNEPIVLNVFYHVLNPSNGINPDGITEEHILASIAKLNINFNQFNIFYKYRGFREVNDDTIFNADIGEMRILLNLDPDYSDTINILITRPMGGPGAASPTHQMINISGLWLIYNDSATLMHEMGHLAGLLHIFEGTRYAPNCSSTTSTDYCIDNTLCTPSAEILTNDELNTPRYWPQDGSYPQAENVTRDINSPDYNADVAGDEVADTPATFYNANLNYCYDITNDIINYISHPDIVDLTGTPYNDLSFRNFMAYSSFARTEFTPGQGIKMRETILNDPNIMQRSTIVASLFRPYKNELELGNPVVVSTTETKDGIETCTIRYAEHYYHYYQPGFDYEFYDSDNVLDHTNSFDELYTIIDDGFIRGIKIAQIDSYDIEAGEFYPGVDANGVIPNINMCYRPGKECILDPFLRGKVVTTPILGSPNISVKDLDSQETIDPNLEQNLESNKYHIIQKTTVSGTNTQKTIYKNGN